jgi:hypothetical protein
VGGRARECGVQSAYIICRTRVSLGPTPEAARSPIDLRHSAILSELENFTSRPCATRLLSIQAG